VENKKEGPKKIIKSIQDFLKKIETEKGALTFCLAGITKEGSTSIKGGCNFGNFTSSDYLDNVGIMLAQVASLPQVVFQAKEVKFVKLSSLLAAVIDCLVDDFKMPYETVKQEIKILIAKFLDKGSNQMLY